MVACLPPFKISQVRFISVPSHTMAPVSLLCGSLLRALVPSKSKQSEQTQDKHESEKMKVEDSDVDSENESSKEEKTKVSERTEIEVNSDKNSALQNQDLEKKLSVIMTEPSDWSLLFSDQMT